MFYDFLWSDPDPDNLTGSSQKVRIRPDPAATLMSGSRLFGMTYPGGLLYAYIAWIIEAYRGCFLSANDLSQAVYASVLCSPTLYTLSNKNKILVENSFNNIYA